MDIDVHNSQAHTSYKRSLPEKDAQGRPKYFFCNNYGHVKIYCRKLKAQQQTQNSQILLADVASLAELLGNDMARQ